MAFSVSLLWKSFKLIGAFPRICGNLILVWKRFNFSEAFPRICADHSADLHGFFIRSCLRNSAH